jgi:hypothetical protein
MLPVLQHHQVTTTHTYNHDTIGKPFNRLMQQCACVQVNVTSGSIVFVLINLLQCSIQYFIWIFHSVYIWLHYKVRGQCTYVYTHTNIKYFYLQQCQLMTWLSEWNPTRSRGATVWCPNVTVTNIYYSLPSVLPFCWYATVRVFFSKTKNQLLKINE